MVLSVMLFFCSNFILEPSKVYAKINWNFLFD